MATDTTRGEVCMFDDFIGDTIDTFLWTANADGGGGSSIVEAAGGVHVFASDGTNGDIQNLFGAEIWRADNGGIVFEARVKLVTSLTQGMFIGLSDDNDADEVPIDIDAGTLTTTATDAVGFVYDSQETGNWYAVGVKNGVDTAQTDCLVGPTVATYQTFVIHVNPAGRAVFSIDGKQVAAMDSCVTATVALCPAFAQLASGTAADAHLDYVKMLGGRPD